MKPISLKLSGINSFTEEQFIDFEKISTSGLFGIFGPTGSGKSTILDAITLAIYGEIPRYTGTNAGAFISTGVESASVAFSFEVSSGGKPERYAIERTYKKAETQKSKKTTDSNGKKFGCRITACRFYKITNGGNEILADRIEREVTNAAVEVIGLNYDDFTRSVVLPQGKFSDFLFLKNSDRRAMLERIFHLEAYGETLYTKIRIFSGALKNKLALVNERMSMYEGIDEKLLEQEEAALQTLNNEIQSLTENKIKVNESIEKYKSLKSVYDDFKRNTAQLEFLSAKREETENDKIRLSNARRADALRPQIVQLSTLTAHYKQAAESFATYDKAHTQALKNLEASTASYDEAFKRKESEYPLLLKKEQDLIQAIQLSEEIAQLKADRQSLLKNYNEYKLTTDTYKSKLAAIDEQRQAIASQIINIAAEKVSLTAQPAYLQTLEAACDIEKADITLKQNRDELQKQIQSAAESRDNDSLALQKINHTLEKLSKAMPKNTDIMLLKEELLSRENKFNNDKIKYNEKTRLTGELSKQTETLDSDIKKQEKIRHLMSHKEAEQAKYTAEIKNSEKFELAAILAVTLTEGTPCPVCGSAHHPSVAENPQSGATAEMKAALTQLTNEIEDIKSEMHKNAITISVNTAETEKTQARIAELSQELIDYKDDYNDIIKAEKLQLDILMGNLNQSRELALEKAKLDERIGKDNASIAEFTKSAEKYNKELENNRKLLEKYRAELHIETSFKQKYDIIKADDAKKTALEKNEAALRNESEKLHAARENLAIQISELEINIQSVITSGTEKNNFITEKTAKLTAITDDRNVNAYLSETQEKIKELTMNEKSLKDLTGKHNTEVHAYSEKRTGFLERKANLSELMSIQQTQLEKQILHSGFEDAETVKAAIMEQSAQAQLENKINSYNQSLAETTNALQASNDKLQSENKDEIEPRLTHLQNELIQIEEILTEKTKRIAVTGSRINTMVQQLKELEILRKQRTMLDKKSGLASDIAKLFSGNRFVEFVSTRHLNYITAEASRRLKKMSMGRYAVELDGTEFIIRDDFDGGSRRPPAGLSGGETFMVSLCLALALSSKIQMKNHKNLSFFFLDEGFGSLDATLLDTVMSALEQLNDECMTVGLITHVEELKSRIMEKIIVIPPKQATSGSKIIQ